MTKLETIPGIPQPSLELLEAAGFLDVESLAKAGLDDLVRELERANGILQISRQNPARESIRNWIDEARKRIGLEDEPITKPTMPVNYEATEQVLALLNVAPLAIPLPARQLVKNKLAVSDVPPAILLNRYSGDLEIRVEDRDSPQRMLPRSTSPRSAGQASHPATSNYVQLAEGTSQRLEIDTSRVKSTADMGSSGERVAVSKEPARSGSSHEADRVALIRAPLEKTNRGRDPRSRFYVRGVLHSHPLSMTFGALVTLKLMVLLPIGIVASGLLLLSDLFPERFAWVPNWWLVFPCALPVLGILYLIYGVGGRCRICTQRVFVPRNCRKNSKAHHVRGLGHIVPMCFHMLFFRWFRCTYCGTPVRLKK